MSKNEHLTVTQNSTIGNVRHSESGEASKSIPGRKNQIPTTNRPRYPAIYRTSAAHSNRMKTARSLQERRTRYDIDTQVYETEEKIQGTDSYDSQDPYSAYTADRVSHPQSRRSSHKEDNLKKIKERDLSREESFSGRRNASEREERESLNATPQKEMS